MKTKLIAALACGAALMLVACSGNSDSGAAGAGEDQAGPGSGTNRGNAGGSGSNENAGNADQTPVQRLYSNAQKAADDAVKAAQTARTEAARTNAEMLIDSATRALTRAVEAAEEAERTAAAGSAAQRSAGLAAYDARRLLSAQTDRLDRARDLLAWYGGNLVRYELASGEAVMPRRGVNTATVTRRIPRTVPTSATDSTPKVNPEAFCQKSDSPATCEEDTFKTVMYEDGNRVFSVIDDGEGGDEFKVDGYVNALTSTIGIQRRTYTGLKLTDGGLVIRTGGTANLGEVDDSSYSGVVSDGNGVSDYTDMRKDITTYVSDTSGDKRVFPFNSDGAVGADHVDGIRGQNGWDLVITFDEPQSRPVPEDFDDISNPVSSWTGNNAFYWKAIAPADPRQLDEDGDYYKAEAFNQPKGYRDLGTYEVWLSNHVGLDRGREPAQGRTAECPDGSRGTSCPSDDKHRYLEYAAYGLFVYTASTETFVGRYNGRMGRVNTLSFGYSAFGTEDGQKTEDIGQAITGGTFQGYTLAYEYVGLASPPESSLATKLLRGDVTLTVNIPKGPLAAGVARERAVNVEGTINNFQQWNEENRYWTAYDVKNFKVALNSTKINENGTFEGTTQATPSAGVNPTVTVGGVTTMGSGNYKGSFYGPRAAANDLEIAGSWIVGTSALPQGVIYRVGDKAISGSFGAKQRLPETPEGN